MRARTLRASLLAVALTTLTLTSSAPAVAADAPPTAAKGAPAPKKTATKSATKKASSKKSPAAAKQEPPPATAAKRRRIAAVPAYVVGDTDSQMINGAAGPIVPFGKDAPAVKKAFSENRRDQLGDAEKAARAENTPDRWRTVLFSLRGLPERTDPEACFWRVLSFLRLGEIQRARSLRENCELPAKDSAVLNAEDAAASGVPEMGSVQKDDGFGPQSEANTPNAAPAPADKGGLKRASVVTAEPYKGPGPQPTPNK
jgi:hypothetical protein